MTWGNTRFGGDALPAHTQLDLRLADVIERPTVQLDKPLADLIGAPMPPTRFLIEDAYGVPPPPPTVSESEAGHGRCSPWDAGPGENMREELQEAGVCFSYYGNWMRAGIAVEWGQKGGNNVRVAGKGEEGGGWE